MLATLLKNKNNINLTDNNKSVKNRKINNRNNNINKGINNSKITFPLNNDAKPFYPKKYNIKNDN